MKKIKTWLLILLALALASWGLAQYQTMKYAHWQSADGVITDIQFRHVPARRRSSDYYDIHFAYRVDGTDYTASTTYSGKKTEQYVGKAVTIWYDPQNPDSASFHKPGPGLWPMVPFLLGIPLALRLTNQRGKRKYGKTR